MRARIELGLGTPDAVFPNDLARPRNWIRMSGHIGGSSAGVPGYPTLRAAKATLQARGYFQPQLRGDEDA